MRFNSSNIRLGINANCSIGDANEQKRSENQIFWLSMGFNPNIIFNPNTVTGITRIVRLMSILLLLH